MKKAYSTREWLVLIIFLILIVSFILPNLKKNGSENQKVLQCQKESETDTKKCSFSREFLLKSKEMSDEFLERIEKFKNSADSENTE
ncbi:MAG: hypothetical protein ACNI25_09040 [Halarcobacter sp.]